MNHTTGKNGFTLLEMTVVIMVLLTLMGTGLFVSKQFGDWQLARAASEKVRSVYAAQRQYLADHPTAVVSSILPEDIIPYLANRSDALPTVESLDGDMLTIRVDVSPPHIDNGSGGVYDKSSSQTDSLWDAGQ